VTKRKFEIKYYKAKTTKLYLKEIVTNLLFDLNQGAMILMFITTYWWAMSHRARIKVNFLLTHLRIIPKSPFFFHPIFCSSQLETFANT
jgi:hypothetical protein